MFVTTLSAPWNPLSASVRIHLLTGSSQRVALLFVHSRLFPPLSRSILRFSVLLCLALLERERKREFNQLQRQRTIIRLPLDEVQRPDLPSFPPSPSASRSLFSGSFFLPRRAGFFPLERSIAEFSRVFQEPLFSTFVHPRSDGKGFGRGVGLCRATRRRNYEASREFKVNWSVFGIPVRALPVRSSRLIKLEIKFVKK